MEDQLMASDDKALATIFENKLKPKLEDLDAIRREALKCLWVGIAVVLVTGFLSLMIVMQTYSDLRIAAFATVISAVIMYMRYSKQWGKYRSGYKNHVVANLLKTIDESLSYKPKGSISSEHYKKSGLYRKSYDRFHGEDYAKGVLGKTAIEFSEIHTEYKTTTTDSEGKTRTSWHTIFQGMFFIADANKHFQGKTYILPDRSGIFSSIGKAMTEKSGKYGERVGLENPEFETHFEVYSDDQVEARYLLSPALMQRLVDFRNESGASNVCLSFVEGNMYIAIPNSKGYFEPKLFQAAGSFDVVKGIYKDIQFITGIVEDLELNTRIWTKE